MLRHALQHVARDRDTPASSYRIARRSPSKHDGHNFHCVDFPLRSRDHDAIALQLQRNVTDGRYTYRTRRRCRFACSGLGDRGTPLL